MSATTHASVENYDENKSNSQSVISTKDNAGCSPPESITSQTSLSLVRNLDKTKHENLEKVSSNDNQETGHFGEDKNTSPFNTLDSTHPFIKENVIIVQRIRQSQNDLKAPEFHRAKAHSDKNEKLQPVESKKIRNCTTPREQAFIEPKVDENVPKTVFCPKPTCREDPDEYVPPKKPEPKPDVPTDKHIFDIILDQQYEKQRRMEREERTVCVTPRPTHEVPTTPRQTTPEAPRQRDQLCMAPECPVVVRKSLVREAKRSEKKQEEKPKAKRPSIFGGILPRPAVATWQECKLTRQEKKVLKRMMQLEREEAENNGTDRYRRRYGHGRVRCFPKIILEDDPTDPARCCGIAECPITIQKIKIREFLNNGRLCATPYCPIAAVPPEPEEPPPPRREEPLPSPPPRVRSTTDCPERSCFLKPKTEEYLRNMDPAIIERYPRLMLDCKDVYTQANLTIGQQSVWCPETNTRDTEYNTVVAHFQVASTHNNPLLRDDSDMQDVPTEKTLDQATGMQQFGSRYSNSRGQRQLLPPRAASMKSNYRNKSKISVLRDKLADIMRPKYKVDMPRRDDRRPSNTRERTNRSGVHGPRIARDQDEAGGCCSARPNTSHKPTGLQSVNSSEDENDPGGRRELTANSRLVDAVRANELTDQVNARTISMMHNKNPPKSEPMQMRLSEKKIREELTDLDSKWGTRNVENVLEGHSDVASDANSANDLDNAESSPLSAVELWRIPITLDVIRKTADETFREMTHGQDRDSHVLLDTIRKSDSSCTMHQPGKKIANDDQQNFQTKLTSLEYVASARQQDLISEQDCRGIQTSTASAVGPNARITVAVDGKLSSESEQNEPVPFVFEPAKSK